MENNNETTNIYEFIDYQLSDLLYIYANNKNKKIPVLKVIKIMLIIESLIPEIVIGGDEMVKYFSKKSHEA